MMKYPASIAAQHDDALERLHENKPLFEMYNEAMATSMESLETLLHCDDVFTLENAAAYWKAKAEGMGFLLGYRYAMQLMKEVLA